jgi:hypothetical protein
MRIIRVLLIVGVLCYASDSLGQNRYWVIPPNYVDMYTGQVLPLPNTAIAPATTVDFLDLANGSAGTVIPGTPLSKQSSYPPLVPTKQGQRASNGLMKSDGTLDFYLTNTVFATLGKTIAHNRVFNTEMPIIPVPQKCGYYFLITDVTGDGLINYKEIKNDGSIVTAKSLSILSPYGCTSLGRNMWSLGVAPYTFDPSTNTVSAKLYFQMCGYVNEIEIRNDGLHFISRFYGASLPHSEVEVSPDGRFVAFESGDNWPNPDVWVRDVVENKTYFFRGPGFKNMLSGIEFSPSSDAIFLVGNDYGGSYSISNPIYGFKLSTRATATHDVIDIWRVELTESDIMYVSNTNGVKNSALELAVDGLMYYSDGTSLKGFDPNNPQGGILKTISIPNTISLVDNVDPEYVQYSLVDQIDGADYSNLFKIGCELTKTYANVTSTNGTLPPITKVSQNITTLANVTVASNTSVTFKSRDGINLKPGFLVSAGGNFRGVLEHCQDFVIDYCATGGPPMIQPESELDEVRVYENPTRGPVNVELGKVADNLAIEVLDLQGKAVHVDNLKQTRATTFDISNNPNGLYILRIVSDGKTSIKKILLIK